MAGAGVSVTAAAGGGGAAVQREGDLEADLVVRHVRVEVGQQFSLLDQDLPRLQVLLHQKIF